MQKVTKLKQRYGHEVHQRAMELAKAMGTCQKSYMWIIYGYAMIYATDTINRYIHIYTILIPLPYRISILLAIHLHDISFSSIVSTS